MDFNLEMAAAKSERQYYTITEFQNELSIRVTAKSDKPLSYNNTSSGNCLTCLVFPSTETLSGIERRAEIAKYCEKSGNNVVNVFSTGRYSYQGNSGNSK